MPHKLNSRAIFLAGVCGLVLLVIVSIGVLTSSVSAITTIQIPTSDQLAVALNVAHDEAATTTPDSPGIEVPGLMAEWPANVLSASASVASRRNAATFTDAENLSAEADPQVVIVQMTGRFAVVVPAPGDTSTVALGTVMTIVADAQTGEVLDFGLDDSVPILSPSESADLFHT